MAFARLSSWLASLRIRLTLWNSAVVFILLAVSLVLIREGLRRTLIELQDEFLSEELASALADIERIGDRPALLFQRLDHLAWAHPRRGLFFQLLDANGAPQWSSRHTPREPLPAPVFQDVPAPVPGGGYRMLERHVVLGDDPGAVLRVGCSTMRVEHVVSRFTEIMLAVVGVLLLLTPFGGYLLAGRATRPLAQIIRLAAKLQPAHLEERLPIRRTRDELDQLSATINGLLDRIAAHLKQSRELTANAAHELRSPLAAIQSSLEVALHADRSPHEYREVLSTLLEECQRLSALVNHLLLLAESDAGKLPLLCEPVRLDQIARKSYQLFHPAAEAAGVQLRLDRLDPVIVSADANRIWQVINNLLDNALKFTPSGGAITLDLEQHAKKGSCLLRVRDSGMGIRPEDLPHIFERFYQGDKARPRFGRRSGTGLGLSICQVIIAAHEGQMEVASEPGAGTTITVHLPCRSATS